MMPTDEERRKIARKLRAGAEYLPNDMYSDDLELELAKTVCEYDTPSVDVLFSRLADLIEPNEPTVKCMAEVKVDGERLEELVHDASVELTSIDRDALLKLTDEMDGEKRDISCSTCREYFGLACYDYKPNATCMEACLRYYARRIRWALGVEIDH